MFTDTITVPKHLLQLMPSWLSVKSLHCPILVVDDHVLFLFLLPLLFFFLSLGWYSHIYFSRIRIICKASSWLWFLFHRHAYLFSESSQNQELPGPYPSSSPHVLIGLPGPVPSTEQALRHVHAVSASHWPISFQWGRWEPTLTHPELLFHRGPWTIYSQIHLVAWPAHFSRFD